MGRPRKKVTNVTRILEALNERNLTTQEIVANLKMPINTARSTLSFLTRAGLTAPVAKVTKPFSITEQGRKQLEEMQKEAA